MGCEHKGQEGDSPMMREWGQVGKEQGGSEAVATNNKVVPRVLAFGSWV